MVNNNIFKKTYGAVLMAFIFAIAPTTATFAANTTSVTQAINGGVLSADILDASRVTVAAPSFAMTATSFSFNCQTSTGTIGSAAQRLYVINPSGTTAGQSWTLSIAGSGNWTSGANTYTYNDAIGAGCTNGQLTVNPAVGTIAADCSSTACTGAVITKGTSTAMTGATPVTLLSAPTGTTIYRGYLTGVSLSQTIPAEKPSGSYSLPMTITATAA